MDMITPVLLAGGSGTRLWPLSRASYPKQFARLLGDQTLFQASATRLAGPGFAAPVVVAADPFRFIVTEQLGQAGVVPDAVTRLSGQETVVQPWAPAVAFAVAVVVGVAFGVFPARRAAMLDPIEALRSE